MPRPHARLARRLLAAALLVTGAAASGCTALPAMSSLFQRVPVADARNPVMDLVCIWQQGEGRSPQGEPCRGFCGQLLFVTSGSPVPARVNGNVKVYVFDSHGTEEERKHPLETFEFTSQQWATFGRKTNVGMTYQLFVPYTRKGIKQADCQIRVRFTPAEGGLEIYSQAANISLEGLDKDEFVGEERVIQPKFAPAPDPQANLNAVRQDLARNYADDARTLVQPPAVTFTPPVATAQRAINPQSQIQTLESGLNRSLTPGVSQAGYSARIGAIGQVNQAGYETGPR